MVQPHPQSTETGVGARERILDAAYELFSQRKCKYGLQKELLYGARVYVLPLTGGAEGKGKPEKLRHFRKLALLVTKTQKQIETAGAELLGS